VSGPGKERILVVEDEPIIGDQMVLILRKTGRYSVELELDGERAAERIPSENPDPVLLDLGLPGNDGLEVIREVRERYFGPIVIVTAKSEMEVHALGLSTGGSDFLKEPFIPDILLAHVECRLRERGQTKGQGAEAANVKLATGQSVYVSRGSMERTYAKMLNMRNFKVEENGDCIYPLGSCQGNTDIDIDVMAEIEKACR